MNKKQRFLTHYAYSRDLRAAAREAELTVREALDLFYERETQAALGTMLNRPASSDSFQIVFDRLFALAFGGGDDVKALLEAADGESGLPGTLDLSRVASLKKKDGAVELTFIDRLAAARTLLELCDVGEDKLKPLLDALGGAATDAGAKDGDREADGETVVEP